MCERTDKVFGLTLVPGSLEPNNATWQELPDHVLSKAKSGHVLLTFMVSRKLFIDKFLLAGRGTLYRTHKTKISLPSEN